VYEWLEIHGLRPEKAEDDTMGLLLLIILVLLLVGGLPTWPYSRRWGYGPSGGLGTVLVILVILMLLGYFPQPF
jgi:hypothetical protein